MTSTTDTYIKWIIDSGATDHVTEDPNNLECKNVIGNIGRVQLPIGDSATVSHVGNLKLNEGEMISNVLCVPIFRFNLLSVYKLTKELNCCVYFFPTCCVFQDLLSGKVKGVGDVEDRLYMLN